MKNENRRQKWAVLLDDAERLSKGEKITIEEVFSRAGHGGGYLETKIKTIEVSGVKEAAPNMLIVQAGDTDYYMYNYNLSRCNVVFPTDKHWSIDTELQIGKQIRFTRSIKRNGFEEECRMSNPVFKMQVIHPNMLIAWCKDRELGDDIGYCIGNGFGATCSEEAPTGNCFWLWDVENPVCGHKTNAKICVDLAGKKASAYVTFVPKRGMRMGEWTLIAAKDGNCYIWQYPFDREWIE